MERPKGHLRLVSSGKLGMSGQRELDMELSGSKGGRRGVLVG